MEKLLTIGTEYTYYLIDDIYVKGVVLFNDGISAILKVTDRFLEGYFEILRYNEVKRFFPMFIDADAKKQSEYLCLDVERRENYFERDPKTNIIMVPDYNVNGYKMIPADPRTFIKERLRRILEYNLRKIEKEKEKRASIVGGQINVDVENASVEEIFEEYEKRHHISKDVLYYGLNRSVHWLNNRNCAILTAWRGNYKRKENDERNRKLQLALRNYGYGVIRMKGCYAEIGRLVDKENSFLVIDLEDTNDFMFNIFEQSENYEQDCFLYKPMNEDVAYLIGSNDRYGKWKKDVAGVLQINSVEANNYSEVGSGRISFEKK